VLTLSLAQSLKIPNYSSEVALEERLKYAMSASRGLIDMS